MADALALFDEMTMTFATVPGERHIVHINGHALSGFQHSDLKFIRLLCLAVAGDADVDGGGWLEKWCLHGDDKAPIDRPLAQAAERCYDRFGLRL